MKRNRHEPFRFVARASCCPALVAILFASVGAASVPNASVEQPRSFGYVVGDIATQRVLLALNGKEFVPERLPAVGQANIWLERRTVRTETDAQSRRWLVIDYQFMNSPQALTIVSLPAWRLKSKDGGGELSVGEWPISVSPLTPQQPLARAGLGALRPDRSAQLIALTPIQRGVATGLTGFLISALAWIGWWIWRNRQASASQPFAIALREMKGLDDTAPQAWHALHRSFDRTAGSVVRPETLSELFDRAPHLHPLRAQIERFFAQSGGWFFGGQRPTDPVSVRALCTDLRRIEKQHET